MKHKIIVILFLITTMAALVGCTSENEPSTSNSKVITAAEAKEMMDKNADYIILDVRTQEEFDTGHIEGAVLISNTEISEKAESILTDKSSTILIYCRSGRRSALAAKDLSKLGYTNLYDFGGINDWTYDIVTD